MNYIQELKKQLAEKQDGFAGLDEVATGLLIVGVVVIAGFVVIGTLAASPAVFIDHDNNASTATVIDPDVDLAINDTKDGLGNLTTFFGIIAIVAALTVVIVLLRRASGSIERT